MKSSILIVEPDPARGEQLALLLYHAGYVALLATDAATALRRLFRARPAAVLISDRLSIVEIAHLCDRITVMTELPMIVLTENSSLNELAQRLTCASGPPELIAVLNDLLKEKM